jgi:peptide/nickel transport system ATP-binding protein/oligopeptide transport system ATP-binding protein
MGRAAGWLPALRGVDFDVAAGRTLALVGESGSGKTTAARIVARLIAPDAGMIEFDGEDWLALRGAALRRKRRDLQIVFQDPATSLNPRMRAGDQVAEPLRVQRLARRGERAARVRELLAAVGLPEEIAERFPSELSGGQRQRVAIARALATRPRLVICDEPASALDPSIGAQILNLLLDLRESTGASYLFISHDLAVVSRIADEIAVMYRGRNVERAAAAPLLSRPLHPYTAALLAAAAGARPSADGGAVPAGASPDEDLGCAYRDRCPIARPRCAEERPALAEGGGGRLAACFFPGEMP